MQPEFIAALLSGIRNGEVVPYLGAGILAGVTERETGAPMPVEHESLILELNNQRPLSPRLMTEFSHAAMHVEQKRGRAIIDHVLTKTYDTRQWTRAPAHEWIAALKPPYVIDINRDTQLQDSYAATPHLLVVGVARMMGGPQRFRLFQYESGSYAETDVEKADWTVPLLFKPLGTPRPEPTYVASDADFVDYITELMGGFAIPSPLKRYRKGKHYLLLGMRFTHDTERMIFSDISYDSALPCGWAFIAEPTEKERRYCKKKGIIIVENDGSALFSAGLSPTLETA
jgi:hypothetical protein